MEGRENVEVQWERKVAGHRKEGRRSTSHLCLPDNVAKAGTLISILKLWCGRRDSSRERAARASVLHL